MKINSQIIVLEIPTFKIEKEGKQGICVFYSGLHISTIATVLQTIEIAKSLQNASAYPPYDLEFRQLNLILKFTSIHHQRRFASQIYELLLEEKQLLKLTPQQIFQIAQQHGSLIMRSRQSI